MVLPFFASVVAFPLFQMAWLSLLPCPSVLGGLLLNLRSLNIGRASFPAITALFIGISTV